LSQKRDQSRCHICKKPNHEVVDCWHRFDEDYQVDKRYVVAATPSYDVDTNWYMDTRAIDHVTGELNKLTTRARYQRQEQIHTTNGTSMEIAHIEIFSIYSPV
jgi:hypothetical protein